MKALTILTHNAYWFQGAPFAGTDPGGPDGRVFDALVDLYRSIGADVVCLQEVQDAAACRALGEAVGMTAAHCPGGGLPQYGGAALWRLGRYVTDSRAAGADTQRMWQLVEAPAGAGSAAVCNVHLPSNRQLDRASAGRRRLAELAGILSGNTRPLVLAGDFNEPPGGAVGEYLATRGYLDAAEVAGLGHTPTNISGKRGDYIWIDRGVAPRLIEYGVTDKAAMAAEAAGREYLSDHCPLWVRLAPAGA